MPKPINILPDEKTTNLAMRKALLHTYFEELVRRTPFKTGETAGAWKLENPKPMEFLFINPRGDIVAGLEGGTKEHIIHARPGRHFLRFKKGPRKKPYKKIPGNIAFEKDGFIFAKMVRHPGFEGRRFIRNLFDDESVAERFYAEFAKELGLT